MRKADFPIYKQLDSKDCGPVCLKIIAKHYGKVLAIQTLRDLMETTRAGTNMQYLSHAAESIGFKSLGVKISLLELDTVPLPCILHWNKNHYVVLYKIEKETFFISDPALGLIQYPKEEFLEHWVGYNSNAETEDGLVLLLEPIPKFYKTDFEEEEQSLNLSFLSKYLYRYKSHFWQLGIGLLLGSAIQLAFPFLTQSIVDIGILNQDLDFIYLILLAQLLLFAGKASVEVIRAWVILHLGTRLNITLVSDFFIKLMKLPIAYFDTRMTGDLLQRISDHNRIERLLTSSSLNVLFSLLNVVLFGAVLAYYNLYIFIVFLFGSTAYFTWILLFLKRRHRLDYRSFTVRSQERSKVIELINGMQTIKLNNAERTKRWSWEFLQLRVFKIATEELRLEQYQSVGSDFINEVKNILITILAAHLVVEGKITLGMMLAISYIVGQLNGPLAQLAQFVREFQDAKIAMERLAEIHNLKDEEEGERMVTSEMKRTQDLTFKNVSFRYPGTEINVLENINLTIPFEKTTAIVGVSGSGKTTLLKLLLQFYEPTEGQISLGTVPLHKIGQQNWRRRCGAVMQEDYIFNDTIAHNIAIGQEVIDKERLRYAVEMANIREFIEELPLSYNTKIGMEGLGLSTGQKQRLLIARAVYRNPDYLLFDEATSALDTNNEKVIMEHLNEFFKEKTVVVIAHRLSTVKNAHQIIVMDKGAIMEMGNHEELIQKKGHYYSLVKNQLNLGN